jgi:hypothetical protein
MEVNALDGEVLDVVALRLLELDEISGLQALEKGNFPSIVQPKEHKLALFVPEPKPFQPAGHPLPEFHRLSGHLEKWHGEIFERSSEFAVGGICDQGERWFSGEIFGVTANEAGFNEEVPDASLEGRFARMVLVLASISSDSRAALRFWGRKSLARECRKSQRELHEPRQCLR